MVARGFWRPWRAARGQSDFALPRVTEVTWRATRTHRSLPTLLGVPRHIMIIEGCQCLPALDAAWLEVPAG